MKYIESINSFTKNNLKLDTYDFNRIIDLLSMNDNIILLGGAGVGKSTNIEMIVKYFKSAGRNIVVTATTGISSFNINGVTINSLLGFGDSNDIQEFEIYLSMIINKIKGDRDYDDVKANIFEKKKEIISDIEYLIIDEISLISSKKWILIQNLLNAYEFKGKIIMSGDIFQLPPISSPSKYIEGNPYTDKKMFFQSNVWVDSKFKPYILENVYRTKDEKFVEILNKLRYNKMDKETFYYIYRLYLNSNLNNNNSTILASTNKIVNSYNQKQLSKIDSKEYIFEFETLLNYKSGANNKEIKDFSNKWKYKLENFVNNVNVEKVLNLKVGALIIFTSNEKFGSYFNGSKGVVKHIGLDSIDIELENGKIIPICKGEFEFYDYVNGKFELIGIVTQFPFKLGYSISIHKSQGMSIDNLILNIDNLGFSKGLFYVGISRATNPKNLKIICNFKTNEEFWQKIQTSLCINQSLFKFYKKVCEMHNRLQDK